MKRASHYVLALTVTAFGALLTGPEARAETSFVDESRLVTWSCTGSPCPWGGWLEGHALTWPTTLEPSTARFGYTTSAGVYLPAEYANRITVWIDVGSATLYAGYPDAGSHRILTSLSDSNYFDVSGLLPGEVLSVQGTGHFEYQIDVRPEPAPEVPQTTELSKFVTWTCTGDNCPWGSGTSGHAVVWPAQAEAIDSRLGYTASEKVYLPATRANGTLVKVENGTATLYAGAPDAPQHRALVTLGAGEEFEVYGVYAGEVLSVQGAWEFRYDVIVAEPSEPEDPTPPSEPPPGSSDPDATSQLITWTCTSSPCPWGGTLSGYAQVWPSEDALDTRLGYTTSGEIYLPAHAANGTRLLLSSGSATLFAGPPDATTHRIVAALTVGVEYVVSGLSVGEVLSVQGSALFSVDVALSDSVPPEDPPELPSGAIASTRAYWRCDVPECVSDDWLGSVVNWPSWAAYSSNNRTGDMSRTVYSSSGELLYPYMGSWADGCEVTAYSGSVLIIEWERGTDVWRETLLAPGETHTIQLVAPEDGAMIETNGHSTDFVVTLNNCNPQPLP